MMRILLCGLAIAALSACTRAASDLETIPSRADANAPRVAKSDAPAPAAPTPPASRLLPPPEAFGDAVITAKVRANILADPSMAGADISVNTTQGVVNLTGLVASQEQAAVASSHAQRQDGVMRVDNHLAVALQ